MKKHLVLVVIVCLAVTGASFAQSSIGFHGVGAKVGIADPGEGVGSTLSFGAVVDLGYLTLGNSQVGLQADVAYWGKSYDVFGSNDFKISSVSISVIGKYYFAEASKQLRPFAGAGLGFSFNTASWEYEIWGHEEKDSETDTNIGLHIVGGADYQLNESLTGFAEFRYILGGDWDYWAIYIGAIFALGK